MYAQEKTILSPELWGRLVESCVGAHLITLSLNSNVKIYYWREASCEVDFIIQRGNNVVALEVKSGRKRERFAGIEFFLDCDISHIGNF